LIISGNEAEGVLRRSNSTAIVAVFPATKGEDDRHNSLVMHDLEG